MATQNKLKGNNFYLDKENDVGVKQKVGAFSCC
jgi:hypothetical protein